MKKVVEDLAANRLPLPGCTDDGDGPRRDEAAHRGCGRAPISILEPLQRLWAERRRQLDMDRSRHRPHIDGKAALPEHLDHAVVLRQDLGLEGRDSMLVGHLGQMGEQDRSQAMALELVRHRKRDLGSVLRAAEIGTVADGTRFLPPHGDQPVAVRVVDVHRSRGLLLHVGGRREEPKAP